MICICPYCVNDLPSNLKNGVIFCPKCLRTITSNKENELLSAFRLIKKKQGANWQQLKCHLDLDDSDLELLKKCFEEDDMTQQEFENYIKKLLCVNNT